MSIRKRENGKGLHVREYEYVPSAVHEPIGARVVWGSRTGKHAGEGWVLIYGDGEHYGSVKAS